MVAYDISRAWLHLVILLLFKVALDFLSRTRFSSSCNLQKLMAEHLHLPVQYCLLEETRKLAELRHVEAIWFELKYLRVQKLTADGDREVFYQEPEEVRAPLPTLEEAVLHGLRQMQSERLLRDLYRLLVYQLSDCAATENQEKLQCPLCDLLSQQENEEKKSPHQQHLPERLLGKHVCALWCLIFGMSRSSE